MKPKLERKLNGWLVYIRGRVYFYCDLDQASNRIAQYYNKMRRKRRN